MAMPEETNTRRFSKYCLALGLTVLLSLSSRGADRVLATLEVPNLSGSDGLFLSPKGELVILENRSVVAIDAGGTKRTLVSDNLFFHPLASCDDRGFIVSEWESGAWPRAVRLIDWQGTTRWRVPKDAMRVDVSPDGFVCFPAAVSNLYLVSPEGAVKWSVPIETGHPWWSGFRIGNDNSVALALPVSKRLVMMSAAGAESWSRPAPWMDRGLFIARDSRSGVVLGGTNRLAAYTAEGQERWQIPFPPDVPAGLQPPPGNATAPTNLAGIAVDPRGYVYCQASDDRVYVLDDRGVLLRIFGRPASYSRQDEWIAFTPAGDAIFNTGEYKSLGTSFKIFGRRSAEHVETDARFVCLSPDGELRWETSLPGHFDWQRPNSLEELKYAFRTRSGSREMPWTRTPLIAPDGTIFLWHAISGRQQAWVHILRGEKPATN